MLKLSRVNNFPNKVKLGKTSFLSNLHKIFMQSPISFLLMYFQLTSHTLQALESVRKRRTPRYL